MAGVERDLIGCFIRRCNRREYVLPDAAHAPAREPIVDRFVRAIFGGAVLPTTAHLLHMHDTAQDAPIIVALRTALVLRQMRLDLRPLIVVEPEQASAHGLVSVQLTKPLNQHMVN